MPSYVHRTTKQFLQSTSPNSLQEPVVNYIENPDMTDVTQIDDSLWPNIYWIIIGDIITLQDLAARNATDQVISDNLDQDNRVEAAGVSVDTGAPGMELRELIEVFNKRDNYLVNRILQLQVTLDAMKASVGAAQTIRDAIPDPTGWLATETRLRSDAVTEYQDDILAGGADS